MDDDRQLAVDEEQFESLVSLALDQVPPELADLMDNCVVLVEDRPPADGPADLLGLYEGIPLCLMAEDLDHLVEEIAITVVHEFAHHVGIDDDRLHELGWA